METTVIVALVTAIAAIISPVITAMINNSTTRKIKEIEAREDRLKNIELHEREVLENALSALGMLMTFSDWKNSAEANRELLSAVAYVDSDTGKSLRKVARAYKQNNVISDEELSSICEAIKGEIIKRLL